MGSQEAELSEPAGRGKPALASSGGSLAAEPRVFHRQLGLPLLQPNFTQSGGGNGSKKLFFPFYLEIQEKSHLTST